MELAWQTRFDSTRREVCFLDSEQFSFFCFCCDDALPGREIREKVLMLEELTPDEEMWLDDDPLDLKEELDGELFDQYGDVLAITGGLCNICRSRYERQWRASDDAWLRARFSAVPTRIRHNPDYLGVINFFDDWEEFRNDIKPKLVFCRLAYPGETPSIDRYWPDERPGRWAKLPYAPRTTRVIPQRLNSGLASRDIRIVEVERMRRLKALGLSYPKIAQKTGRSISSVWRKINDKYCQTLHMR